ncbi:hypothetical protein HKD37_11G031905 [Glycine soja]
MISYKTNRYRLSLLDIVDVTPTGMTFSTASAYLEGEHLNNVNILPRVIVTDRDLALMNVVKIVFPEATNLLCRFHIDKNVKAKCKTLVDGILSWKPEGVWWIVLLSNNSISVLRSLKLLAHHSQCLFDYVNQTWLTPHKERFVKAWTNKVIHLGSTTTNSVWESMNNMITLLHTKIKASFKTNTHVVGQVFKVTLYKRLLGMIAAEFEHVHYVGKNPSRCGCIMRTIHGLPCACELSRYVVGTISLETIHVLVGAKFFRPRVI